MNTSTQTWKANYHYSANLQFRLMASLTRFFL